MPFIHRFYNLQYAIGFNSTKQTRLIVSESILYYEKVGTKKSKSCNCAINKVFRASKFAYTSRRESNISFYGYRPFYLGSNRALHVHL